MINLKLKRMKRKSIYGILLIGIGLFIVSCIGRNVKTNELNKPSSSILEQKTSDTIKIGNQEWMVGNLDVSKFRNGESIPEAKTKEEWKKADENWQPAWCYLDNDSKNGAKYGKLYNWFAVNDPRGLAPEGWHVPSNTEWLELVSYLGNTDAGTKLKSTSGWEKDGNGTNESGFSGLPGGKRASFTSGRFSDLGKTGYWWNSTEGSNSQKVDAFYCYLNCNTGGAYSGKRIKGNGLSVRCLRD
jgi:uncharacterized protein (TIGR02145 family)